MLPSYTFATAVAALAFVAEASPNFRIGYAVCEWVVYGAGGTSTVDTEEYWYFNKGSGDITCGAAKNDHFYGGLLSDDKSSFKATVCGKNIDFYKNNGNWDFYNRNGDGTRIGTCYPHNGNNVFCNMDGFSACHIHEAFECEPTNWESPPC